jgi:7-cyano-7-deazaguanine synthase in queuosine biosynthesis
MIKLVMLSGGLDSTYLSWKMMSEGETPHLHHVHIINKESIGKNQYKRMQPILSYFKKQEFDFKYTKSKFENKNVIGFDSDLLLLVAQKICWNIRKPVQLVMGWNPFDMTRPAIASRAERNITSNLWNALIDSTGNKFIEREISFPLIEKNIYKKDMIREMPKELFDLTWSCRRSRNNIPCNKCHACIERNNALNEIKKIKKYK